MRDVRLWPVRKAFGVIEVNASLEGGGHDNVLWQTVWLACGVATIIAGVLASRSTRARYVGRAAVGVLFIGGGALLHVINLASRGDYAGFADPAHFAWVTDA